MIPAPRPGVDVDFDELVGLRLRARRLRLDLAPRRESGTSRQRARLRGRGMDYAESRVYVAGDDSRHMDWKVTARSAEPHTKVYQPEHERPVFLVVDLGPSMRFGTRGCFKSVLAARAAALLAWAALACGDRVGGLVTSGAERLELRPGAGRASVLQVLRALSVLGRCPAPTAHGAAAPHDRLASTLERARLLVRPGALVVVLSDFYGLDAGASSGLRRLGGRGDLLLVGVCDALEIEPPPAGRYPVSDGDVALLLDTEDDGVRAAYADFHQARRERLSALARRLPAPLIELLTHRDPLLDLCGGRAAAA